MADFDRIEVFNGVPGESVSLVTDEMRRFYSNGETIVVEGGLADSLIVLLRGEAKISTCGVHLITRGAGEIIGEQALIEDGPRGATVIAVGTVEAVVIPKRVFEILLKDVRFSRNLLKVLSKKLNEATAQRAFRYRNEELLMPEFSAHVSPEIRDRLLAAGKSYGEPRYVDATILMADVRSFTATCGKMKPAAIAAQLTPYLDAMVEVIHRHGGFVDKFIGDAILAAWGIVPNDGDAATQAFACAREMVAIASKKKFGGLPIRIGVGLNRGRVFAGNVGGSGKRQFTILGTAVNLTQRFESHTKTAKAEIVAGNSFYMKLPHSERTGWTAHRGTKFKGAARQTVYSFQVMKKSTLVRRAEFVHRNGRRK